MTPSARAALDDLLPRRTGENVYEHALRAEAVGLLNMAEVEEIRMAAAPQRHAGPRIAALFAALGLVDADADEWSP